MPLVFQFFYPVTKKNRSAILVNEENVEEKQDELKPSSSVELLQITHITVNL